MVVEQESATKLFARAGTAFAAFEKARAEVRLLPDIAEKAMVWNAALTEYCKATKFLSEAGRRLGRNSWADAVLAEQKSSPVLNYLLHARNADNHGLEEVTASMPGELNIGGMFSFVGDNTNVTISNCREIVTLPDGSRIERLVNGSFSTRKGAIVDGWLASEVPVTTKPEHLSLRPVMDRGINYPVPSMHVPPESAANEMLQKAHNWLFGKMKFMDKAILSIKS